MLEGADLGAIITREGGVEACGFNLYALAASSIRRGQKRDYDPTIVESEGFHEFLLRRKGHKRSKSIWRNGCGCSATQLLHTLLEWR
jgi:hypothetical protein